MSEYEEKEASIHSWINQPKDVRSAWTWKSKHAYLKEWMNEGAKEGPGEWISDGTSVINARYLFGFLRVGFGLLDDISIAFEPLKFEEHVKSARAVSERSVEQIGEQ